MLDKILQVTLLEIRTWDEVLWARQIICRF